MPDSGTIIAYRSSGGFGVRLDAGMDSKVQKFHLTDSLLVKLSTHAVSFKQAEENGTFITRNANSWRKDEYSISHQCYA